MTETSFRCRICGSADHEFHEFKERQFGTLEAFRYACCQGCGCLQIVDMPKDLGRFYPSDYYAHNVKPMPVKPWLPIRVMQRARVRQRLLGRPRWAEALFWRLAELPWAWTVVGPYLRPEWLAHGMDTTFLDVGCGNRSWWLDNLAELGFRHLLGIDPLISGDQTHGGIPYRKAELRDVRGTYDFISLHHSLEHIPDQVATLRTAAALLSDGGILMIGVPIFPSALWREYGDCCMSLDAPRHLYLHSPTSLALAASKAGLAIVERLYDMTEFNLIGSERFRRGLPLFENGPHTQDRADDPLSEDQVAKWRALAASLNAQGTADQATFVMKRTS